jgi:hypothetical protein
VFRDTGAAQFVVGYDEGVKPLAVLLAVLAFAAGFAAPAPAQTAPPPSATSAPRPWRPVIIVDPRAYLASPTPGPKGRRHATPPPHARRRPLPVQRRPLAAPTPETFERLDTSPAPRAT